MATPEVIRLQECSGCLVGWPPDQLVVTPDGGRLCPECAVKRFGAAFAADPQKPTERVVVSIAKRVHVCFGFPDSKRGYLTWQGWANVTYQSDKQLWIRMADETDGCQLIIDAEKVEAEPAIRTGAPDDPNALDVPVSGEVYEAIRERRSNGPVRITLSNEESTVYCNAEIAWTDQAPASEQACDVCGQRRESVKSGYMTVDGEPINLCFACCHMQYRRKPGELVPVLA